MTRYSSGSKGGLLYAVAFFGAHLSFIPLFTLLLPRRVELIDPTQSVKSLSLLLLVGGVTASVAHIGAGWWSDRWLRRHGSRRTLIGIGLVLLLLSLSACSRATTMTSLCAAIIAFQLTLNLMFAPLGALLSDHFADDRKGRVAGWLNASLPLSNGGTFLVALLFPKDGTGGFALIAFLVATMILPLVALWPFGRVSPRVDTTTGSPLKSEARADFGRIWTARLAIQIGAAFVISYFYLYLGTRYPSGAVPSLLARLAILAMAGSFLAAVAAGHWSDAQGRRRPPMILSALSAATGLALLAFAPAWPLLMTAYVLFHLGLTAFLSVDYAMVAQLLGPSERRGELLGYMNLTNTFPAIIVPSIGLVAGESASLVPWPLLFLSAGGLALVAAILVGTVRTVR